MSFLDKIKSAFFSSPTDTHNPAPEEKEEEQEYKPRTVVGGFPSGTTLFQFIPNESFYSEETKSQYVKGMKYTVREGNTKLKKLAKDWRNSRLVTIL